MDDFLIDEARKAGQAYIDSFKGDDKAMLADLRRREQAAGRVVVSLASKKPREKATQS